MSEYSDDRPELVRLVCCRCTVEFGVTKVLDDMRRKDGKPFYCPVGCGQSYQKSDAVLVKEARHEAAVAKSKAEKLEAQLEDAKAATKKGWFKG